MKRRETGEYSILKRRRMIRRRRRRKKKKIKKRKKGEKIDREGDRTGTCE